MSFTNLLFLFLFLPISLTVYYVSNDSIKEYVLLVVSLVFYAFGSLTYLTLFIIAILITVAIGRAISYLTDDIFRKIMLVLGVLLNLSLLLYYKYTDFIISIWNKASGEEHELQYLLLPLGISFFSFKAISYLVDVYQRKVVLSDNPVHDMLYLSFFAQVISGPLTRYADMNCRLKITDSSKARECFSEGVYRFIIGYNKKVLIADVMARISNEVFEHALLSESFSTSYAWLGSVCFSLQLYYDFAGYSDMAIGISEMFGYYCTENFQYPYMTESIAKFWRRWHISLSHWFRDYVYIPLGGSRTRKRSREFLNLFVVWLLTGLWHGAAWSFVTWGLGYFAMIVFEKITGIPDRFQSKLTKCLYRLFTLMFINAQWVLFRTGSFRRGVDFLKHMLWYHGDTLTDIRAQFLFKDNIGFIIVAVLLCFPVIPWIEKKMEENQIMMILFQTMVGFCGCFLFLLSISFVISGQNNPFAYANF